MSTNLEPVWHSIANLLADNVSVFPIRDKDDDTGVAKAPFNKQWGQWQKRIITKDELWHDMERFNTTAIAMVCGKVSGDLEVIDLDEKHLPGISARLLSDLKELYPDLFARLRIHATPSKGFHLLYRCPAGIEGNQKLAGRPASATELANNPKAKPVFFLETRGEGGYIAAPPSLNYSVIQDVPIPVIDTQERSAIISLCRSYTYILPPTLKPYKPTQAQNEYYDTNPFDDFNNRVDPVQIATELGWTEYRHNNKFIWFTRPGGSKNHVHLSFNIDRRFFFCFTANTELQEHHGYTPANMVAAMLHQGDKKKTHAYLVSKGYGKVKEKVQLNKASKAARSKSHLPANFSDEVKRIHAEMIEQLQEFHPFGTFWKFDDEGTLMISRELLYRVADGLGLRYHSGNVVRLVGKFIYKVDEREFQDILKSYIKEPDSDMYEQIADAYESFMQRNGAFSMKRLPILNTSTILADNAHVCYKFFNNGYLSIDSDSINFLEYDTLEAMVWFDKVQDRPYQHHTGGKYVDFLNKAIVDPANARPVIGYLAHEYKDETTGYIIVLTEQCADPRQGGGSGKNVFCNLLSYTTSYTSKPGVQAKFDEKFFQSWNGQRVFGISDVPKGFDFAFLKEPATGSFIWKKLFKDEIEVKNDEAPKFIVQTNFSYEVSDGGLKRRIVPIEFTDFFTKVGGLDVHYNCHFPKGWTQEDWNGFDTYVAKCVQLWIQDNRKLTANDLTETGWEKQFIHTYGATASDFIAENFQVWQSEGFMSNEVWSQKLNDYYRENDIKPNFHVGSRRLYEAVAAYCKKHNWEFINGQVKRIDHFTTVKGKMFIELPPF